MIENAIFALHIHALFLMQFWKSDDDGSDDSDLSDISDSSECSSDCETQLGDDTQADDTHNLMTMLSLIHISEPTRPY